MLKLTDSSFLIGEVFDDEIIIEEVLEHDEELSTKEGFSYYIEKLLISKLMGIGVNEEIICRYVSKVSR